MAMFLSLDEFQTFCKLKSGGASYHSDKGVCKFRLLIFVMSLSSEALLDHKADSSNSSPAHNRSGFCSIRATTMAVTWSVAFVWTPMSMRCFSSPPAWRRIQDLASKSRSMLREMSLVAVGL